MPIPCRLCRGGGAASLLRLTTSCPLSPDTRYPARWWAGGRWCRVPGAAELSLIGNCTKALWLGWCGVWWVISASPRDAGPVSSGGGCVLQSCSKTWASCSHSQWAAAGPASSWGQGEIIPVPGSRCWTLGRHSPSVQNSATFPMLLLKSSKKVVFLNQISSE